MKRNPIAKREIELERLKMALERNFVSADVQKNGLGAVDAKRLERSIDQIGESFKYTNKPKVEDIYSGEFLPPAAERAVPAAIANRKF
mgnify:CR=1 FL=1